MVRLYFVPAYLHCFMNEAEAFSMQTQMTQGEAGQNCRVSVAWEKTGTTTKTQWSEKGEKKPTWWQNGWTTLLSFSCFIHPLHAGELHLRTAETNQRKSRRNRQRDIWLAPPQPPHSTSSTLAQNPTRKLNWQRKRPLPQCTLQKTLPESNTPGTSTSHSHTGWKTI